MNKLRHIGTIFALVIISLTYMQTEVYAQGDAVYENTEVFTVTSLSSDNLYVGVPVCYSVKLYSTNPSIDFVRPVSQPEFNGFDVTKYPVVRTDRYNRIIKEEFKGKIYYTVWLEDVVLIPKSIGTYLLKGEDFIAGINEYEVFTDPFWGTVRRAVPEEYPVKGDEIKVKVSQLPKNLPEGYTGAVGEYSIRVRVNTDVLKGEDEILTVHITGQGDLSDIEWPDLMTQFPSTIGVRSMSQDCRTYLDDGVVRSDLTFECGFSPLEEGELTIPALSFKYFDPIKKKFRTAQSAPVEIMVKSSSSRKINPTIIQEI